MFNTEHIHQTITVIVLKNRGRFFAWKPAIAKGSLLPSTSEGDLGFFVLSWAETLLFAMARP